MASGSDRRRVAHKVGAFNDHVGRRLQHVGAAHRSIATKAMSTRELLTASTTAPAELKGTSSIGIQAATSAAVNLRRHNQSPLATDPFKLMRMPHRQRFDAIDVLRGLAVVWMTIFHFCFDLNHFGYIRQDFYADPFWTAQRSAIITLFLLCAGMGQAFAVKQGQDQRRFLRRWAQIAGCALLVSAGSYWMFPHSFIYFGVLHCIAAALIVVRLTAGWGRWLWLAGAVVMTLQWIAMEVHAGRPWLGYCPTATASEARCARRPRSWRPARRAMRTSSCGRRASTRWSSSTS